MLKKLRLDQLLVGRGFFPSREQARRAILAGDVRVGTGSRRSRRNCWMPERLST